MTDLAIRATGAPMATPEKLSTDQLKYIASSDMIPKHFRGNMPSIMAAVLTGRALGIDDMHALRSIYVVDGKATISAELMAAIARKNGHSITGEVNDNGATVTGKRGDNGDTMTVTWTMEDASRAGLTGKGNWKTYPKAMMWARGVSQLCRMLFPDVFLGLAYTGEEMGEEGVTVQVMGDAAAVAGEAQPEDEPVAGEVVEDALFAEEPF